MCVYVCVSVCVYVCVCVCGGEPHDEEGRQVHVEGPPLLPASGSLEVSSAGVGVTPALSSQRREQPSGVFPLVGLYLYWDCVVVSMAWRLPCHSEQNAAHGSRTET